MIMPFNRQIAVVGVLICVLSGFRCQTETDSDVRIDNLVVTSNVSMRFSEVSVQATLVNSAATGKDTGFIVSLPKSAFITSFYIVIKGEKYKAEVKEKTVALSEYSKALENNTTAGYISQQTTVSDDFDRDKFNIAVNIAPKSAVSFDLRYQELIERHGNVYKQKLYVNPKLSVSKLEVILDITETKQFNTFQYRTPFEDTVHSDDLSGESNTPGYYTRKISWQPTQDELLENTFGEDDAFDIFYDLVPAPEGGEFVTNDEGLFAHYFSTVCSQDNVIPKRIVFVIDVSGSMKNEPINQVKVAMNMILDQLRTNEQFNIILFSDKIEFWKAGFITATQSNIDLAKVYLTDNLIADGATNINDAVLNAIRLFPADTSGSPYGQIVVLLTDGTPTSGEQLEVEIRKNVKAANFKSDTESYLSSLFTVAFGKNSNRNLLGSLAKENGGVLKTIKENGGETSYLALYDFFKDLENPYYKNVNFTFYIDGTVPLPKENTTQSVFPLFDCGGEIIVSGWSDPQHLIQPRVNALGLNGSVEFTSVLQKRATDTQAAILAKLIIYKHIKKLLGKLEESFDEANKMIGEEAKQEALDLALKHGLVTPLTSMVITSYSPKRPAPAFSNRMGSGVRTGTRPWHNNPQATSPLDTSNLEFEKRLNGLDLSNGLHNSGVCLRHSFSQLLISGAILMLVVWNW